jgi:hypothetical protein
VISWRRRRRPQGNAAGRHDLKAGQRRADEHPARLLENDPNELRDRRVAVDFARANPVILAALTRRLNEHGVSQIVHATTTARGSEIEMAAQVRNRHLVMLMTYAPSSLLSRMFSPPEFKLIPIDETTWEPSELAIAWARAPVTAHPALDGASRTG